MASSHYELATWIEKYIIEKYGSNSNGFLSLGSEWSHLEQLFTILRVAGSHKHSEVTRLVDDAIGSVPLGISLPPTSTDKNALGTSQRTS